MLMKLKVSLTYHKYVSRSKHIRTYCQLTMVVLNHTFYMSQVVSFQFQQNVTKEEGWRPCDDEGEGKGGKGLRERSRGVPL